MVTEAQAREAKEALRRQLNRPSWMRGIGLSVVDGEPVVVVNVQQATPEVLAAIPKTFDGVKVFAREVGDLVAQEQGSPPSFRLGKLQGGNVREGPGLVHVQPVLDLDVLTSVAHGDSP